LATFEAFCAFLHTVRRLELAKKKTAKKSTKKGATKPKKVAPTKSPDIPATKKHIDELRAELKSELTSMDLKIDSFRSEMNSRLEQMDSKIEKLIAASHRTNALVEAQEDRNRYVLDGYTSLNDRVERLEKKVFDENM
jgi:uncharacterized protein YlxW (UPF0749 family)